VLADVASYGGWSAVEIWILVGVGLLILELLIPGFIVGSFGASSLAAAGAAALGASFPVQVAVFSLLGLLIVLPARHFLYRKVPELKMGVEQMQGRRGLCLEAINGDLEPGVVQLDGVRWTALASPGVKIAADAPITVLERSGTKLHVAPATEK
jgi:membrane protein implicated in regulation of membrane protease activity